MICPVHGVKLKRVSDVKDGFGHWTQRYSCPDCGQWIKLFGLLLLKPEKEEALKK